LHRLAFHIIVAIKDIQLPSAARRLWWYCFIIIHKLQIMQLFLETRMLIVTLLWKKMLVKFISEYTLSKCNLMPFIHCLGDQTNPLSVLIQGMLANIIHEHQCNYNSDLYICDIKWPEHVGGPGGSNRVTSSRVLINMSLIWCDKSRYGIDQTITYDMNNKMMHVLI
jgi:hypothetical protein